MFTLEKMTCFADNISVIRWNKNFALLFVDMEEPLEAITKWLRKSSIKVNDGKTEICLFQRKNQPNAKITINANPVFRVIPALR